MFYARSHPKSNQVGNVVEGILNIIRAFAAQATDLFTSLPNQCEKGYNPPAAHPFTKSC